MCGNNNNNNNNNLQSIKREHKNKTETKQKQNKNDKKKEQFFFKIQSTCQKKIGKKGQRQVYGSHNPSFCCVFIRLSWLGGGAFVSNEGCEIRRTR